MILKSSNCNEINVELFSYICTINRVWNLIVRSIFDILIKTPTMASIIHAIEQIRLKQINLEDFMR